MWYSQRGNVGIQRKRSEVKGLPVWMISPRADAHSDSDSRRRDIQNPKSWRVEADFLTSRTFACDAKGTEIQLKRRQQCLDPFWTFKLKCTCVLCQSLMIVCIYETQRQWKENKCCFRAASIRELVSLLVCACVYKGGGCRQTGSRGLRNRTGHHNSSAQSLATDRQAGVNADGSLIGICHQQPTKGIYLRGKPSPILTLKQTHIHHTYTHNAH